MSSHKYQIFVSHSSKDTKLVKLVDLAFANSEIKPYFARLEMEGKNPLEKIVEAINNSICLFALITPTVVSDSHTRDWVVFEVGVAEAKGVKILCWMDETVEREKNYPMLLDYVTDYDHFNCQNDDDCIDVAKSIRDKAFGLAGLRRRNSDYDVVQLKTGLNQIEKAQTVENECPARKNDLVQKEYSEKESEQKSVLLPDNRKIDELNIDNSCLNQIYETAQNLAKDKYHDAKLASFSICVYPFSSGSRVFVLMKFYSKLADRVCTFRFCDFTPQVEHSPPDVEVRNDLDRKVLENLPWEVSSNWKQFLKISVAKTGPLAPNSLSRFVLSAFAWGTLDLGKTDVFWNFHVVDNFAGKEHMFRWNGREINEQSMKQDF